MSIYVHKQLIFSWVFVYLTPYFILQINPEAASLILDDSFSTSLDATKAQRIAFDTQNPVPCWSETLQLTAQKSIDIEMCVAPVLICRVAKKTAGAGDNISAAGLSQQL